MFQSAIVIKAKFPAESWKDTNIGYDVRSDVKLFDFKMNSVKLPSNIRSMELKNCSAESLDLSNTKLHTLNVLDSTDVKKIIVPSSLKHIAFNADETTVELDQCQITSVYWRGNQAGNIKMCKIPYNTSINRRTEILDALQADGDKLDHTDVVMTAKFMENHQVLNGRVVEHLSIHFKMAEMMIDDKLSDKNLTADALDGMYYCGLTDDLSTQLLKNDTPAPIGDMMDAEEMDGFMNDSLNNIIHGARYVYIHQPELKRVMICEGSVNCSGCIALKRSDVEFDVSNDTFDEYEDPNMAYIMAAADAMTIENEQPIARG